MPRTRVVLFMETDGTVPVLAWLSRLPPKVADKCVARIERLRELGHELRRPEADLLRDGIRELRIGHQGVHYRVLYFFHGNVAAVLSHGIVKTDGVPPTEIDRAVRRMALFAANPPKHTYEE